MFYNLDFLKSIDFITLKKLILLFFIGKYPDIGTVICIPAPAMIRFDQFMTTLV